MSKNTSKLFLSFVILLFGSCQTIKYEKVNNIHKQNDLNTSKYVEYYIDKDFDTDLINCIIVGKINDKSKSNYFLKLDKSELIRNSVFGFLSVKNYDDIELSRVNNVIEKNSSMSNEGLLKALECDAAIIGDITKFESNFFISYSITTVEIKLKLIDKSSKVLWSAKHTANSQEGSLPLSPLSLLNGFVEASANRQDEVAFQMIDTVSRRVLSTLPDKKNINLENEFVNKNILDNNFTNFSQNNKQSPEDLINTGDFEEALKTTKILIKKYPNVGKNYVYACKSEFKLKKYSSSIDYCLTAISKGNNNHEIFSLLGVSYLKEGKNKLAYASFYRALNIEPKISLTNYNYGIIKEIQNNWKEAGESYYIAGLQSIKENNKKRLYKSLKSLERVRRKNIFLEVLYIRLNQKVLTFLKNG